MYKRNYVQVRSLKNNSVVAIWHRLLSRGVNAFSDVFISEMHYRLIVGHVLVMRDMRS